MKPVAAQLARAPSVNWWITDVYISCNVDKVCLASGSTCFSFRIAAPRK